MAGVELAGTSNPVVGADHLIPVSVPAYRSRHCEDDGEHRYRNADGTQDDARIEVDVRIQLALDEVRIFECDLLEASGNLEQRIIFQTKLLQYLIAGLFHDFGARIEVLVDAMPKAHQTERIV